MNEEQARRLALGAGWLTMLGVAFALAPDPNDGLDGARVAAWLRFDGPPASVAMFNTLGVWPLVYGAVLLKDETERVPAWPFVALSFVGGGYLLFPYFFLVRRWGEPARHELGRFSRVWTGPGFGIGLSVVMAALIVYGVGWGSLSAHLSLATRSGLVSAMTVDFVGFTLMWWPLWLDDVRRHPRSSPGACVLGAIPVIGAPLWLVFRRR
ncbi:MAG: hypothetical protein AAGA56_07085 [Myxococcota bacterium]